MINEKYKLYFNTLKYLKPAQFYHRGFFIVKRKAIFKTSRWQKKFKKRIENNLNEVIKSELRYLSLNKNEIDPKLYNSVLNQKKSLENQEFEFLNNRVTFEGELGWKDLSLSQLWRYNLHYFDYFRGLIEVEVIEPSNENYLLLKRYVESWIVNNKKIGQGDGWHPYTISLRLVNWILAYNTFVKYIDEDQNFKNYFLKSIVSQNQFLLNNLEYDVVGNHLFENLKTLIICGMFMNPTSFGKKSKDVGEGELVKQLAEQFHNDGGHFELSAMYHSILLKGLTELTYLYKNFGFNIPTEIINVQRKAYKYLVNIIHPDGEIPLFNDAAFGIAESPVYLLNYAYGNEDKSLTLLDFLIKKNSQDINREKAPLSKKVFYAPATGYLKTEDHSMFSLIDVGKPCPDYLPAHAHADIFSYELSYKGERFVVDTGTYEYSGLKRDYDRSTKAHNTLTINNDNQSQVWGNFRVADRGFPVVHNYIQNAELAEIVASHDGYNKKYAATHIRKYLHIFNEMVLVLDKADTKEQLQSYIHFHPNVKLRLNGDVMNIIGSDLVIKPINAQFSIENSIYHPRFGFEEPTKKVIVTPIKNKPFGYFFYYGSGEVSLSEDNLLVSGNKSIRVNLRLE